MARRRFVLPSAIILAALLAPATLAAGKSAAASSPLAVKVSGNRLIDQNSRPIRLLGVAHSGSEYACAEGWGIFDGYPDSTMISAMASWHTNAVRIPLNEDCWLAINGVKPAYGGVNYQSAIASYVARLHNAGLVAVLDLHWSAPGAELAKNQQRMPDRDHAPDFWRSVATYFKGDPGVLFELYNEPYQVSWDCWRNGGCTLASYATGANYVAAGMQELVNSVRGTGATQPILAGGPRWANDLSQWLTYTPTDPAGQLGAAFHVYKENECVTASCWDAQVAPVAASVPVVTSEFGEMDCAHSFVDSFMNWADAKGISYIGWAWNPGACTAWPSLIDSYNGSPSAYGIGLRDHLAQLSTAPATTTTTVGPTTTTTTTPPAPTTIRYDFEDGTNQGWGRAWGPVTVANTQTQANTGTRALAMNLTPTTAAWPAIQVYGPLAGIKSGTQVTYWIYQPTGATISSVQPYVADLSWNDVFSGERALATGWNKVTWAVPSVSGINALGLQINDDNHWSGQILLDSVSW